MAGGSGSDKQQVVKTGSNAPWGPAQPVLKQGLQAALPWFNTAQQQVASGQRPPSTVVPFAPQTEEALQGIEARARQGNPLFQPAQQEYLKTIQGGYLSPDSNPFLQGAIDVAQRSVNQNFLNNVVPTINAQFAGSGRYGSGAQSRALGDATGAYSQQLGDIASKIAYDNYAQDRARQLATAGGANALQAGAYQDLQALGGVGSAREGLAAQMANENLRNYLYPQEKGYENIARLLALGGGQYGGTTFEQQQGAQPPNSPFGAALGGGLGGATLGYKVGGPWGAAIGGVGGGILGALS